MAVQGCLIEHDEQPTIPSPDAGVIQDDRSRQQRQRGVGASVSVAVGIAALLFVIGGGGGGSGRATPPATPGGAPLAQTTSLRLPEGRTTSNITIRAPAGHAFDINIDAPVAAALTLTTRFGFPGPTINTLTDPQICSVHGAETTCVVHFAAGGNPGGRWTWTVTKTSIPATRARIRVVFNSHLGDYRG